MATASWGEKSTHGAQHNRAKQRTQAHNKVIANGSVIRTVLGEAGITIDSKKWGDTSGKTIASCLIDLVKRISITPEGNRKQKIADIINRVVQARETSAEAVDPARLLEILGATVSNPSVFISAEAFSEVVGGKIEDGSFEGGGTVVRWEVPSQNPDYPWLEPQAWVFPSEPTNPAGA
jgi:hypothetical protein